MLMPDHLHLLLRALAEVAHQRLGDLVRALRRRTDAAADIRWLPVEEPVVVPNGKHGGRQVRYLHLNPCRDGLARDPLAWPWSTHRDAVGAIADPWVTAAELARELGRPRDGFEGWLHRYVSGDPTVAVQGTPCPKPAPPSSLTTFPLLDIAQAAAAATRAQPVDICRQGPTRDLFLRLAIRDGWRDFPRLAAMCAMTSRGVRKNLHTKQVPGIDAAALALGDPRLLVTSCPPPRRLRPSVPPEFHLGELRTHTADHSAL
ncbi:MAG: hypothetical protein JRI23_14850 [Deltaproteobacteria bacterium]|nr:hypothetical protein [Deltaproteobacteria bacterium]